MTKKNKVIGFMADSKHVPAMTDATQVSVDALHLRVFKTGELSAETVEKFTKAQMDSKYDFLNEELDEK